MRRLTIITGIVHLCLLAGGGCSCSSVPDRYQPPIAWVVGPAPQPRLKDLLCPPDAKLTQITPSEFSCLSNGLRHGPSWYVYSDGTVMRLTHFVMGEQDGIYTSWYDDGTPDVLTAWKNGVVHGKTYVWYKGTPSRLEEISEYEDGKQVGEWLVFHPNGIAKRKGTYVYGFPHGEFMQWSEEGELLGTYRMEYGKGTVREWYENGVLASSQYWVDGKPKYDFAHSWYNEDGTLQKVRIMWGDGTYWETRYDADGTETETCIDGPCPEQ